MKTENIKFFYNGIKVNGGKLIKCFYSVDNNINNSPAITIYCKDYHNGLPRDIFDVENNSDPYTDYFDDDHTTLTPDHPLYHYARAAALKREIRSIEKYLPYCDKRAADGHHAEYYKSEAEDRRARLEKYRAELETLPSGHPTAADLAKIDELKTAAENARKAREHAEQLEQRETHLRQRNEGRAYIEQIRAEYPILDGAPTVTINWSESSYLSSYEDGELVLSVAAAEIILKRYDVEKFNDPAGYDKTSFTINFTEADGQPGRYDGRYDLGDNEGGLLAHIRSYGEFYRDLGSRGNGNPSEEDKQGGQSILDFVAMLEGYTAEGRIVSVDIPDGVISFADRVAELQQRRAAVEQTARNLSDEEEDDEDDYGDIDPFDAVKILTNEQIEDVIMRQVPGEDDYIARFFLQELYRRDEKNAMRVLKRWQGTK